MEKSWKILFEKEWSACSVCPGDVDVFVGGQQPNQATSLTSNVLHGEIHVRPSTADDDQPNTPGGRMTPDNALDDDERNTVIRL